MYSDQLSNYLRTNLQPMMRFRQFTDVQDALGYGNGEQFLWNIYSDVEQEGDELNETEAMPNTNFTISQAALTVTEYGNAVPFTKKLDDLSKHPVQEVIRKVLKNDAAKVLDKAAYNQFAATRLLVTPTGGTSATSVTFEVGSTATVNNVPLSKDHVKAIVDEMKERNIPGYEGDDYFSLARPSTYRPFKDDLETIYQNVESGARRIYQGEIGLYEGTRFVEQTRIASKGWTNGESDEAFFMGGDTVTEGVVEFEQIRGKIPTDYGRSKGIAWYYLGGFGISHNNPNDATASQNRIIKWTSAS
jgi:N4-gp56 family major capsid protein